MMRGKMNGCQQTILDVFRVLAAFAVILGHSFSFYQVTILKDQSYFPWIQNIGVIVFFLLSGFLSALSIERKNRDHQYTFSKFFEHKAVRIFKEYLPGLMIIAIIDAIFIAVNGENYAYYQAFSVKQFIGNAFMLHNMGPNNTLGRIFIPFGSGRPLWTLAVEWWLYMLFGMLYLLLANHEKLTPLKALGLGFVLYMCSGHLITGRGHGLGFVFLLGVLSYYCYDAIEIHAAIIIFPLSCLLYIAYGLHAKEAYTIHSFIILWAVLCSALKLGGAVKHISKRNAVLAFLSNSTFMLYLVHYSVINLIVRADIAWSKRLKFSMGIAISLAIAFFSHYLFVEKNLFGRLFGSIRKKCGIKMQ